MYKKIIITLAFDLILVSCSNGGSNSATSVTPPPVAPAPVTKTEHRMFITSNAYSGNLGGLSAADTICNNEATAAGLTGPFKAFLVDEKNTPNLKDRFPDADQLPVNSYDGKNVVNNISKSFSDLITDQFNFDNGVIFDTSGNGIDDFVWTGLQPNGSNSGVSTCLNWTTNDPKSSGRVGNTSSSNEGAVKNADVSCDTLAHLYCVD